MKRTSVRSILTIFVLSSSLLLINMSFSSASPSASVSQLWKYTPQLSIISSPVLANGFVYISDGSYGGGTQSIHCLNALTGTEVWRHIGRFATFVVANGKMYVGESVQGSSNSFGGVIACLDASTGVQLWNYSAGTGFTTPVVSGDMVFASGFDYTVSTDANIGFIYAFNSSTGEKLWNFLGLVGTRFDSNSLVLEDAILYAKSTSYSSQDASWHSGIYAFNAYTGEELWNYTTSGQFGSLLAANHNLYVSSNFVNTTNYLDAEKSGGYIYEGGVFALDGLNGTLLWNYPINSSVNIPIIMNNTIYAVSGNGILYALSALYGGVVWSYNAGTGLGSLASINGYLYVGSSSGVYCFNANDGTVIWNFVASDFAASSPTLSTYTDGIIYVGWNGPMFFSPVTEHNFYALSASNGEKLWSYTIGYTITSSPTIQNGTVYISGSFVTLKSPDYESSGVVLALKPSVASLPLPPLPTPTQPVFEFLPLIILVVSVAVTVVAVVVAVVYWKKRKR